MITTIWIGSPNFNKGRGGKFPKQIVVHWFGSEGSNLASTDTYFQRLNGTSAHFGVEDDSIHQYVQVDDTAWAVGNFARNQETISIEHSANVKRPASELTYQTSAKLIAILSHDFGIPLDRDHIIGHKQIKATQCPGTMDIDKLILLAKKELEAPMALDFKPPFLQIGDKFGDQYNENWNTAEKQVYIDKILKKTDDVIRDGKDKDIKISQLQGNIKVLEDRIKELEQTPSTQPQSLQALLSSVGVILDQKLK